MTVRDYVRLLRRHWLLVVLGLIAGGALAAGASLLTTPMYQAQAKMFVSTQSAQSNADLMQGGNFAQQRVQSYADVTTSPRVLDPVIERLALDEDARGLAKRVTAQTLPDTVMLVVSATDEDPSQAAAIADATAESLTVVISELEKPSEGPSPVRATIVQAAETPAAPVTPKTLRNIALGLVLGSICGLGAVLLRQSLDTRVRSADDVKNLVSATLLGSVPFDKAAADHALVVQDDPHGLRSEALRQIRTNLQFVDATAHPKSVVITSCVPGEGKSSTAANLAITMAEAGQRICVIEADLRRPKVVDYLGLEGGAGLTTVLIGEADLDDVLQPWAGVDVGVVDVLATGPLPPNPSELLGSQGMNAVVAALEERYDVVIIDAPPLLPVTDATVLATIADGVILIVGSGRVDARGLVRGVENLTAVDARLLGVVVNRVPVSRHTSYYGYGYGYTYTSNSGKSRKTRYSDKSQQSVASRSGPTPRTKTAEVDSPQATTMPVQRHHDGSSTVPFTSQS